MNEINSFKMLIGTLYKKLNIASIYGTLNFKELYMLNIVNNFLDDCPDCLNNDDENKLQNLSIQLQHLDSDICIYRTENSNYYNIMGVTSDNFNNNLLQVVNTSPTISDPDPIVEETPIPTLRENIIYCGEKSKIPIENPDVTLGFTSEDNSGPGTLLITGLPEQGFITLDDNLIQIGDTIDLTSPYFLLYTDLIGLEIGNVDILKYKISSVDNPTVFSEENQLLIKII